MYNDKNWEEYRTKRSWLILRCYPSTAGHLVDALECRKKRGKFVRERGPNKQRMRTRFLQKDILNQKSVCTKQHYVRWNLNGKLMGLSTWTVSWWGYQHELQVDGVININYNFSGLSTQTASWWRYQHEPQLDGLLMGFSVSTADWWDYQYKRRVVRA